MATAEDNGLPEEGPQPASIDARALQALIEVIPAGVIVCDAQGTLAMHNQAADVILGTPITGTAFGPRGGYTLHRPDGPPLRPENLPLSRAILRGETTRDEEVLVRRATGAERTVLVSATPIRDRTGRIFGALAVFFDVTEQRQTVRLLHTRERQQEAIAKLGQEALAGTDLSRLFDDAARLLADTLSVEFAMVLELLPGQSDLLLRAGVGWKPGLVGRFTVEGGASSQAGYALNTARPVIVEDLPIETRFKGSRLLRDHAVVSGICVIIAGHQRPFGVLGAHTRQRRRFTVDDINFVQALANVLALAIERTRAEDVLRRQAQIIDQVHEAVVSTDLQGRVTSWNKGAEELFGFTANEALGRDISFVYPASAYPEGPREFLDRQVIAPLLAKGSNAIEVTLQRKSGEQFIAEQRLSLQRSPEGQTAGLVFYSMDITDRRRAEEELYRAKEHLHTVTSNAPIVLFALDAAGVFTLSTGKGLEVLGLKPGQVVGSSVFDVYQNEPAILAHVRRALNGEAFDAIDTVAPDLVWETRWVPLRDSYGSIIGVIGVATNATERYRGEQAKAHLLAKEEALAQIAQALVRERELAKVVDVVIDQSQVILGADVVAVWLADPVRQELTVLSARGVSPATVDQFRHLSFDAPSLAARAARECQPQVMEDIPDDWGGLALTRKLAAEGQMRSALALPLKNIHLVGVVAYLWREPHHFTEEELAFNITIANLFAVAIENAHLNDQIRQALEVREEFMAAAAHELRTPLAVIKGRTQLLLKKVVTDARIRQQLEAIVGNANRMTRSVNDLLLAARVRPDLTALHLADVDLTALVRERVAQLEAEIGRKSFHVHARNSLIVRADPELIGEVITRLAENALIYSPAEQSIEINVKGEDDEAVVSVTDHGVGIPVERQPHVFEPFYQAVPVGAPGYTEVVSLGLYLCKDIVQAHGGRIWLVSTPGKGSTFAFSLPC